MKKVALILCLLAATTSAFPQQFIGCRVDSGWAETPILRKTFRLTADDIKRYDFHTVSFDVHVASLGYHEVYVNYTRVSDHVMQPAVSQLDKRALDVEYDISHLVQPGENLIEIYLGQGWGRVYGTPAVVRAEVTRTVSDGECGLEYTLAITDTTWEASPSPYSYTGSWQPMQFGGERYDARVKPRWHPASVYDTKNIAVTRQEFEGNRIVDTVRFQAFELEPDSSLVIDFGRVVTGWFAAVFVPHNNPAGDDEEVPLPAGTKVTMEYLDHRDAKPPFTETDIYISDGKGRDIFRNRFHMHSFRYVRIKGAGLIYARALQISAVDPDGGATFECSDPRLNAIHDMVKYTLSCLTFSGYMVDCPHIERMGYGGDGNSSTNTLQTLWDVRDLYRNWLSAWGDAIDSTGDLPYVAPAFRTGGGPYWQGFIVKAPWRTYLNYGDRTLIYRHYNDMKRWLEYIEHHSEDYILRPWPDNEHHSWFLGDWAVPELWSATSWSQGVDKGGESVLHVSNCFLAECLADMVQMARMTGHHADAERFSAWRERLVKDIHRHFYHPESHTYANGTVLDQCYALLQGIPPDSATAQAVKEQLLKDIHGRYRDHIAVGLVGVHIFTEWCIREGQSSDHRDRSGASVTNLMATILRQEDYPGYLNMINQGATTTWESWDCGRPGKEDRSRVHNCYNGIGLWFYQAVAGIRPDPKHPGYKHFFIDPQQVKDIDWVKCTKPTPYGTISIEIQNSQFTITIPAGTTATLFPGTPNQRELPSGTHIIEL